VSLALIHARGTSRLDIHPGETLQWAAQAVVPRALFGSKHDPGTFGNDFGRAYGVVLPVDHRTSYAVTQPGELYLNFGVLGILFGMPVIGGLFRVLSSYLRERGTDPLAMAIYASLGWAIVNGEESIVAVGLVGIFKLVVLYVALFALGRRLRVGALHHSGPAAHVRSGAA
jgi:hypothetical protein